MFSHYKSIEFDGSEEIDGRPNYKLLLTNRDGKEVENYFDAETGLLRRIICNEISSGRKVRIVRDFLSYEQFGEFVAWKKLVMTQSDGKTWTFEVEEYESDGRIPKGIFDLPPAMKTLIAQSKAQKNSDLAKLKTD
jgi:hypothetical protein